MSAFDTLLDRSIAGGYSRIGYAARSRGWPDDDPRPDALTGRTVLVTGATSGIGAAIAMGVAELGARPILVGRDAVRAEGVRADIARRFPDSRVAVELCDMADLSRVRELADRLLADGGVDVLVHNAGAMPAERTTSADGHELSLAVHVLGPVLLTELLLPNLAKRPDPRVIFMSSGGMYTAGLPVDDLGYERGEYRGAMAYARSKRVQTALVPVLAQRWVSAGVLVAGMHPGWVDTPGVSASLPGFTRVTGPLLRSVEQGADTAIWLTATAPRPRNGQFWHDRQIRREHYLRRTRFSEPDRLAVWRQVAAALDLPADLTGGITA
ncbi:SDR family NAD(P)-dependent oxidoreductase [Gordonia crocea]|uniref:Short-chain dehydrogenase n=1 Tax=Gordonia crocea TaxID=589162 RepID=A0A7M3SUH1_9ACTN|nr:SDR family NAD(P)-dependent oxidoreductase [Gordonia crocea]GED96295.1 hypothetical protein nbrc107697_03340 [Gordonia crocea]